MKLLDKLHRLRARFGKIFIGRGDVYNLKKRNPVAVSDAEQAQNPVFFHEPITKFGLFIIHSLLITDK